jgi:ABC-type branched-subunit amino acid transport system substrate-binding protein
MRQLDLASQALAAFAIAVGFAYGPGARAENGVGASEIVIGQSASLTGTAGEVGQQLRDGALAYFELVNRKGGVNGRKIRLISLDDGGQTKRGEDNTNKLIGEDKVLLLFGYTGRNTSEAALPIIAKADIPFFGAATGGETIHGQFNKNVINVRASYRRETEALVDYAVSVGQKKIGMIYHKDDVTKSNLKMTEDALMKHGLKIAGSGAVDRNSTDVKEALAILTQVAPEVMVCNAAVKPFGEFVRQMRKAGAAAQFMTVSFVGSPLVKELGADSAGVIMSQVVPLPTKKSIPIVNEYQSALAATGSKAGHSFNGLEGFITAKVFVEALKRTGKDVTRQKFIKAVEGITELDLGGYFVSYSPTKHNGSSYVDITVINKEGRFFN